MVIRAYKTRIGFGRWATVEVHKCPACGQEIRLVVNWRGPRPRGGVACRACGEVVSL